MTEPRIRLELSHARTLDTWINKGAVGTRALYEAKAALARAVATQAFCRTLAKAERPLPQKFAKPDPLDRERKRNERHARKARRTMAVYDAVRLRAGMMCECGCGRPFNDGPALDSMPELDDYFGGAKHEDERKCWYIRADCHRDKTANRPSKAAWLRKFIAHCRRYGFGLEMHRAQAKLASREDIARAGEEVRRVR